MIHALAALLTLTAGQPIPDAAHNFPIDVQSTGMMGGKPDQPTAVARLVFKRPLAEGGSMELFVGGHAIANGPLAARNAAGEAVFVELPLPKEAGPVRVHARVVERGQMHERDFDLPRPEPGWTLHFIPGFHYDPVWWNTQANYTETGAQLATNVGPGLTLMREHLRLCREDADYRVALHQLPYLKTFCEARPEEVSALQAQIRAGKVSLVGGSYNEMSSTLISAEAMARNAIYGTLFQREVLGGRGNVFWQCDVFGHDPSFPSLMADAGHVAGAFARGPFHQWGPPRDQVNFPSEFFWMAPDGRKLLTHYMTGHYGYAYEKLANGVNRAPADFKTCEAAVAEMFDDLRRPALTHHVMLPMHMDFIRPMENLGDVVRAWNAKYLSPKAIISTPDIFFEAVNKEFAARAIDVPVITRDMNPIYTGCQVSFADLKLAERAGETTLRDAELFATLAALEGAPFPWRAIDRAWRQLLFCSHHDGVTGSSSDQVYLDLMYAYRDALEIATRVRDRALAHLNTRIAAAKGASILWNPTAGRTREGAPPVGYRVVTDANAAPPGRPPRRTTSGRLITLENAALRATIDLDRGGAVTRLFDKRVARELLRGPANDIAVLDEYDTLPGQGEGPWHLAPTGRRVTGTEAKARLAEGDGNATPADVVTLEADDPAFTKRQTIALRDDPPRLDFRTEILNWRGRDQLLRAEFPLNLPGARPVYQTAAGVIGRPFAHDGDAAKTPWTLDQSCWQWVDYGTTCLLETLSGPRGTHRRALSVGEIVVPRDAAKEALRAANRLAEAFVRCGVTTTLTRANQRRYGDLALDSNAPDFRVILGLDGTHDAIIRARADELARHALCPNPDGDMPTIIALPGPALDAVIADLKGKRLVRALAAQPGGETSPEGAPDYGIALVNRGAISAGIREDGRLCLNLLRGSSGWPSGLWIDSPGRRHPDGSPLELMHGSHVFEYSLVPHKGDFRAAHLSRIAEEINEPILRTVASAPAQVSDLPATANFVEVDPPDVLLAAMKLAGFPDARWSLDARRKGGAIETVALRLWNGAGASVTARIKLRHAAGHAWRANLLEQKGEPLTIRNGWIEMPLEPNAFATVLCDVAGKPPAAGAASLDPTDGDVSPSAYWLENRGEGATGNAILAIAPTARQLTLKDGAAKTTIRVVNNDTTPITDLRLETQASDDLNVRLTPAVISIAARSFASVTLDVAAKNAAQVGRSVVTLAAATTAGRSITGAVWIAPSGDGETTPPIEIRTHPRTIGPGGRLRATIVNHTRGPISGEAAWLSSMALWPRVKEWRRQITIAAGLSTDFETELDGTLDSYALLRFTTGGRVFYGESVATLRDPQSSVLAVGVDRIRVVEGREAKLDVTARSVSGLSNSSPLSLELPTGWSCRREGPTLSEADGEQRLQASFFIKPLGEDRSATARLRGPDGAERPLPVSVVPLQVAHADDAVVTLDGELSEWRPEEFTQATSELGTVRGAVRYGEKGLTFAFEVTDDGIIQPNRGASIWRGDSVQFGLAPLPPATASNADVYEFGAALTPDGPIVWCWVAPSVGRTGLVAGGRAAVTHHAGRTRYEVFLPHAAAPSLPLHPGAALGLVYCANDDDGSGFRGAIQWARGMSGGKDASLYGELDLVPGK